MKEKILNTIKKEPVLCVSFAAALLSMGAVPPDAQYAGYIDARVLGLLFALMAVVKGFESCGVFNTLAQGLLLRAKDGRSLCLVLVLLPFFSSMLLTNDVALLAFVPFALYSLRTAGRPDWVIPVVVLQTIGANLGSMATPVGNPQNLYLYGAFGFSASEFFTLTRPYTLVSLIGLVTACLILGRGKTAALQNKKPPRPEHPRRMVLCAGLFALCLLSVFRVLPWWVAAGAVALGMGVSCPALLKKVDWALLATFVFFFVFSGNLGRVQTIRLMITGLLQKNTLLAAVLASQVISNVPAALLLSGFTGDGAALLLGVDIGGLGTPVASMASLISLQIYRNSPGAHTGKYLAAFTAASLIWLAVLLGIAFI